MVLLYYSNMEVGRNLKINFLRFATITTILLFLYTGFQYVDQSYQAVTITDTEKLISKESILTEKRDYQHYQKLGFSDEIISHLTQAELNKYNRIAGKIVDEKTIYRKIKGEDIAQLTREEYSHLLKMYSKAKLPQKSSLERVHLSLVQEGNRRFSLVTEHHFDYSPHDLKPLGIELQLHPTYTLLDQTAKQIWWTASSLNHEKFNSGVKNLEHSFMNPNQENNEFGFFNDDSDLSIFYSVPWKQPSLLEDIIGLHVYTVTEFEVPEGTLIVSSYIQGQNPHFSEQVFFDFEMEQ
jgi:hypothetical protein